MATSKSFEQQYPAIDRLIEEFGWIEIGQNDMISAFVRAYSEGGTVYEGKDSYPTMDAAFKDLDRGIQAFLMRMECNSSSILQSGYRPDAIGTFGILFFTTEGDSL